MISWKKQSHFKSIKWIYNMMKMVLWPNIERFQIKMNWKR